MANEYIEREAAINVVNTWVGQPDTVLRTVLIHKDMNAIPAADVVEVVRCKDCKHWYDAEYCAAHGSYGVSGNDFCSYGERREVQDA